MPVMAIRRLFATILFCVGAVLIVTPWLVRHRHILASAILQTPQIRSDASGPLPKQFSKDQHLQIPSSSGHTYHALELFRSPNQDVGQLVEFDPWSFPILSRGFIVYQRLDSNTATATGRSGLRYVRDISDDTNLYDVMLNDLSGDFMRGTDFIPVGQIAVKMSRPGIYPDTLQIWDIEPKGTIEGTTAAGIVVRIPLVRFWRYHASGLDASEPIRVQIPPQHYKNGWAENPKDETWKLPLPQRRLTLDRKYDNSLAVLNHYVTGTQDSGISSELTALITDAQSIREQVHEPLSRAIKSGEITDRQAPARHLHWQMRNFNAEFTVEQAAEFLTGSESTKTEMRGYSAKWESETRDEYSRIQQEYEEHASGPPNDGCVPPTEIHHNFSELSAIVNNNQSSGNPNSADQVLRVLRGQMLASELSQTLGCYTAREHNGQTKH